MPCRNWPITHTTSTHFWPKSSSTSCLIYFDREDSHTELREQESISPPEPVIFTASEGSPSLSSRQTVAVQLVEFNHNEWPYAADSPRPTPVTDLLSSGEEEAQRRRFRRASRTRSAPAPGGLSQKWPRQRSKERRRATTIARSTRNSLTLGGGTAWRETDGATLVAAPLDEDERNGQPTQGIESQERWSGRQTGVESNVLRDSTGNGVLAHPSLPQPASGAERHADRINKGEVRTCRRSRSCHEKRPVQRVSRQALRSHSTRPRAQVSLPPGLPSQPEESIEPRPVPKIRPRTSRSQSLRLESPSRSGLERPSPRPRRNTITSAYQERTRKPTTLNQRNSALVFCNNSATLRNSGERTIDLHIDLTKPTAFESSSSVISPTSYVIDL